MQIRNNYDIMWKRSDGLGAGTGILNGDIGTISRIDFEAELVSIDFDDRQAEYSFDMLSELEPAYAMTVHKSCLLYTSRLVSPVWRLSSRRWKTSCPLSKSRPAALAAPTIRSRSRSGLKDVRPWVCVG